MVSASRKTGRFLFDFDSVFAQIPLMNDDAETWGMQGRGGRLAAHPGVLGEEEEAAEG
jgi:hypothetical protein